MQDPIESLERIVSGGQTGVDRAALDAAIECGLSVGGWCPQGRRAEDGRIDEQYPLRETPAHAYAERTSWNVRDSDGTLVILAGPPEGGTALTIEEAARRGKLCLVLRIDQESREGEVAAWIRENAVRTLNVAGPRESEVPGIYRQTRAFLEALLCGE